MEMIKESPANQQKLQRASVAWLAMLDEGLQRGFHGRVAIELTIQDGTIQKIGRSLERIER